MHVLLEGLWLFMVLDLMGSNCYIPLLDGEERGCLLAFSYCKPGMLGVLLGENLCACVRLVLLAKRGSGVCRRMESHEFKSQRDNCACLICLCSLTQSRGCLWINACLDWRISLGKTSSLELEISTSGGFSGALGHSLIISYFPISFWAVPTPDPESGGATWPGAYSQEI